MDNELSRIPSQGEAETILCTYPETRGNFISCTGEFPKKIPKQYFYNGQVRGFLVKRDKFLILIGTFFEVLRGPSRNCDNELMHQVPMAKNADDKSELVSVKVLLIIVLTFC